jgi:hypothetical protein
MKGRTGAHAHREFAQASQFESYSIPTYLFSQGHPLQLSQPFSKVRRLQRLDVGFNQLAKLASLGRGTTGFLQRTFAAQPPLFHRIYCWRSCMHAETRYSGRGCAPFAACARSRVSRMRRIGALMSTPPRTIWKARLGSRRSGRACGMIVMPKKLRGSVVFLSFASASGYRARSSAWSYLPRENRV